MIVDVAVVVDATAVDDFAAAAVAVVDECVDAGNLYQRWQQHSDQQHLRMPNYPPIRKLKRCSLEHPEVAAAGDAVHSDLGELNKEAVQACRP